MTVEELQAIRDGFCPLCLRPRDEEGGCPSCGWRGEVVRTRPNCLSPGTVLRDRYLVGQPLGQGGFSITYLVIDLSLNLRLCLKEFFPSSAVSRIPGALGVRVIEGQMEEAFREGLEQFLLEGRILARLSGKPGIIEVRDLFQMNGTAYMVTDLLEGVSLRNYLEEKEAPLSPDQALKILMPVMDSLRAVHDEGIVHCDISPENLFLTTDGQVRLLDFGSARNLPLDLSQGRSIVVKPGYAAPEQYRSRGRQGPWTDVYGLAATFFRCVAGTPPPDALDRLENDPLMSCSEEVLPLSGKWRRALLRGMAVQVGDRFQDVPSFQFALCQAGGRDEELAPNPGRSKGSFMKILSIGLVLSLAVASGGLLYLKDRPERLLEKADKLLGSGQKLRALEVLTRAETSILAEPVGSEVVALCRNYFDAGSGEKALGLVLRFPDFFQAVPEGPIVAARVLYATGRGERALKYLLLATEEVQDREDYWLLQGEVAFSLGEREQALAAYQKAVEIDPDDPLPRLTSARILSELSLMDRSEEEYVQALTLDPENGPAWEELARLRQDRGSLPEAIRAWERVAQLMPDRPSPWIHLGEAREAVGDFPGAAGALSEAVRLEPDNGPIWAALGRDLIRSDSPQEALAALDRALQLGTGKKDGSLFLERGKVALELKMTDRAQADFERVLSDDPSQGEVWRMLAELHGSQEDPAGAASVWERALPYMDDRGAVETERGEALMLAGMPAGAESSFREALSYEGENTRAALGLASALMAQSRSGEAIPYIRKVLALQGGSSAAHLLLGEALLEEEAFSEALLHLLEARRHGSEGPELLLALGRGYLGLDQYGQAVDYFRKVLAAEPQNVKAVRLLEESFYRWGQDSGAVAAYGEMARERESSSRKGESLPSEEVQSADRAAEALPSPES